MQIALDEEYEIYIKAQVSSGRFASADEVVADALKAQMEASMQQKLDERIDASLSAHDAGNYTVANERYFDGLREQIRRRYEGK